MENKVLPSSPLTFLATFLRTTKFFLPFVLYLGRRNTVTIGLVLADDAVPIDIFIRSCSFRRSRSL